MTNTPGELIAPASAYCMSCGTALGSLSAFCPTCGTARVTPAAAGSFVAPVVPMIPAVPVPFVAPVAPVTQNPYATQPYGVQPYGVQPGYAQQHPYGVQYAQAAKSKTTSVVLAVFLGFWAWLYTYKLDAWKFWVQASISFLIGVPLALTTGYGQLFISIPFFIWVVVDVATKPTSFYDRYPQR